MRHRLALSVLLSCVVSTVALANNPQVAVLREQVKVLRAEESNIVKLIKAQYNSIINFAKLNERQLGQLRKELQVQERQYLSLTANGTQKTNIRRNYEQLRRVLGGEVKLDAAAIRQLREQETLHVRLVQTVYKAKILEMEQAIQVANKVSSAARVRRR
jgi:hypothetical protein